MMTWHIKKLTRYYKQSVLKMSNAIRSFWVPNFYITPKFIANIAFSWAGGETIDPCRTHALTISFTVLLVSRRIIVFFWALPWMVCCSSSKLEISQGKNAWMLTNTFFFIKWTQIMWWWLFTICENFDICSTPKLNISTLYIKSGKFLQGSYKL